MSESGETSQALQPRGGKLRSREHIFLQKVLSPEIQFSISPIEI